MRKTVLNTIIFLVMCYSCSVQRYLEKQEIEFHFQEGFEEDNVSITIEGIQVYVAELSTLDHLGYAGSYKTNIERPISCIIKVNEHSIKQELRKECPFVSITYSDVTKIFAECSQEKFMYN